MATSVRQTEVEFVAESHGNSSQVAEDGHVHSGRRKRWLVDEECVRGTESYSSIDFEWKDGGHRRRGRSVGI